MMVSMLLPLQYSDQFEIDRNDIEFCEEVYPQYKTLGLDWFLENYHYSIEARVCGGLYEDVIWKYTGADRIDKLLERAQYYLQLEIQESEEEAKTGKVDPTPARIPSWIKNVAEFWVNDQIDDSGFVQVIEYLVQKNIISIPNAKPPEGGAAILVPSWIKMTAAFWADELITDAEFAKALEWLINHGIVRV